MISLCRSASAAVLGMFREKTSAVFEFSMTRVVAFLFALVYLAALWRLARLGVNIGWPFAMVGIFTLLAVPLQALFQGSAGPKLAEALIGRLGLGAAGANATAAAVAAVERLRGTDSARVDDER